MATEAWIESACRTDEELFKPAPFKQVEAGHLVPLLEEEVDPVEQTRAARWLRRERPQGWMVLLEALGLPEGGELTKWEDDPAACLEEARADEEESAVVVELAPHLEPERDWTPPSFKRRGRPMPRPDWNWQDDAACSGHPLSLFFGMDGERGDIKVLRERQAKAVCALCPVRRECLDYALSRPEKYGTWAGLNEDERASERRRRMRNGVPLTQAPTIPEFKRCGCCREVKAVEDFNRNANRSDGLSGWCRPCVAKGRKATWVRSTEQGVA